MLWDYYLIFGPNEFMLLPAVEHLFRGFAFGAVFMAADPVGATQTNIGKYVYGFLIGLLLYLFVYLIQHIQRYDVSYIVYECFCSFSRSLCNSIKY